jgi:hypothetical protein
MRIERIILIAFIGNYLINNIVAAAVAMMGLAGNTTAQYAVYFVLASIATTALTWWFLRGGSKSSALMEGAVFGVSAFLIAVATALLSGMSGVLTQTGSFSQLIAVLPNFGPFLMNWSTLALLGYWVLPAAALGFWVQMSATKTSAAPVMGAAPSHSDTHSGGHSM